MSKIETNNKSGGKLSVKGCNTAGEENNFLRKKALKSVDKNNQFEKTHKFKRIKIKRGALMVEMSKYLKNKKHYDSISLK